MFNILEFQTAFATLHFTVRQRILHGKSGYSVHSVCSYIAQNVRLITGVLSNDIAAIRSCTALYVETKCSHTLQVQYTKVSNCFLKTTFNCKTAYFTGKNWVQCAYGVFLHYKECALNHGYFSRRYRSDPAM